MIYLHIGTHKTGTSALQSFLSHRADALREQGVRYVTAGTGSGRAHHDLPKSLRERGGNNLSAWEELREELAAESFPINVVSSEGFWFCDPALVKEQLDGMDVRIVLYLRRQDKYLQSLYKQTVTGGRKMDFEKWHEQYHARGDYHAVVEQWADQFGAESLIIRPYEREEGTIDIVDDFNSIIGVDSSEIPGKRGGKLRNPSPRRELLTLLRALNYVGLEFNREKFFWTLIRSHTNYVRSGDILNHKQCIALMEGYSASNDKLIEKFYRDAAAPLFPLMKRGVPLVFWGPDDREHFEMTVEFLDLLVRSVASGEIRLKTHKKKNKADADAEAEAEAADA